MATKLERLEFAIGMKDQASGKLGQLRSSLDKLTGSASRQFGQARDGVLGAVATGYSIHQMVAPAIDLNRALGEVSSLGRSDTGLAVLQAEAQKFAMAYGGSAAEVIRAGYDIQSAIDGLTDRELARFTAASGVLAKASKADVATMTSYMGTMYGIFKNTADGMGKSRWVEEIAGQTAYAVGLFKSSGAEMSAAFTALGANATAAGRSAAEQMAILGTLQATMSGSESGTKYKAFLAGVGTAQKELGLTFTDTRGNMLGMVDILDRIRGKFGDTLSVAESDQLKKAFGSDEAVSLIKQLMMDTDGLKANMANIANIKGMDNVTSMAARMTDIWGRLGGTVNVLAGSFGQKLLPPLEEIVGKVVDVLQNLVRWIDLAPNLARWVGYGAIAVMSLATVMGIFTAVVAVNRIALMALGGPLKLVAFTFGLLTKLTGLQTAATWLFNAALWANPTTWVVLGIVALIAAVGALVYWWDDLKAAFLDTTWGQALMKTIDAVMAPFRALGETWDWLQQKLGLAATPTTAAISAATGAPQAAIESTATALTSASATGPLSSLEAARTPAIPAGGLLQATTNQINKGRTRQTTIGSVTINADQPMTPGQLDEWAALQAG
ncbi:phage tail tape measure protein [Nitratidesulfovibrio sp. HK-II]|uniref:phage tail tape measure protein n=1 Tax=Nitratidesulfovibrio sp. HK-II TaxID=2009266 RepID=UPI000E2F63A6|nr:phage tail tape measure protein [Nitratidesulfovibrio sp. HK-II]GBO96127.1 phage tail length tape-measure protein [Nitratidesulfovibrio sp. HK-II]